MQPKKANKRRQSNTNARLRQILGILARNDLVHGLPPDKLRHMLEDLGPTFVKLGQILSMRPDILPDDYCRELALLRSEVRPMAYEEVLSVLESEYGRSVDTLFTRVDPEPLGAASIAQVHRAVLKAGGDVVVKVQRPGIYETMAQDIRLLRKAAGILRIVGGSGGAVDFFRLLDELWTVAQQEMDFLMEAGHIRDFTQYNEGVAYVAFPQVYWDLTTAKVLVMEYIDGVPIDHTQALAQDGYELKEICRKLAANYVKQVLDDGFFHADPHPGNIRIRGGKIVWLDLGMVGRLSVRDRQLCREAIAASAENDIYALKNALLALGKINGPINHTRLYDDIETTLARYGTRDFGSINLGQFLLEVIKMAGSNGIALPAGFSMLGRGMLTMEGVLSGIDPEISFLEIVSAHMADEAMQDLDLAKEFRHGGRALLGFYKRAAEIPGQMSDILRLAAKGQSKINVEFVGSEEPLERVNRMVNRLIVCLLCAAVLIGSSLICTTDMHPKLLGIPLLGVLGYGAAFGMSVWLAWGILARWRRR